MILVEGQGPRVGRSPFGRGGQGNNDHFGKMPTTSGGSGGTEGVYSPPQGRSEVALKHCVAQVEGMWKGRKADHSPQLLEGGRYWGV